VTVLSVKIRLARAGAKKAPFYRIVVADSRAPRDGRFIEIIGRYNPRTQPSTIEMNVEKADAWIAKGAELSETAAKLLAIAKLPPAEAPAPKAAKPSKKATAKAAAAKKKADEPKPEPKPEPVAEEAPAEAIVEEPAEAVADETPAEETPAEEPAEEVAAEDAPAEEPAADEAAE
jgi:small subunit ribosomal protein S16